MCVGVLKASISRSIDEHKAQSVLNAGININQKDLSAFGTGRRNYNCPACNLKIHRDVVGAVNIRTKHLTGVLSGNDNFKSPKVKYLRIDHWAKSSSVAGVNRREKHKFCALDSSTPLLVDADMSTRHKHKFRLHRRRLGVPTQLTLFQ